MNRYAFMLIAGTAIMFSSCSDRDNPEPEPPVNPEKTVWRISSVTGDKSTELYLYDDSGNVTEFTSPPMKAIYDYSLPGTIGISVEESDTHIQRFYEESLSLNAEGIAETAEGIATFYENGYLSIQKKYRKEFVYNSANEMIAIKFSEWNRNGDEWINEWTWENHLTWEDGNITEYVDYNGSSHPVTTETYEYWDKIPIENQVISIPTIIYYYHPLQLAGVFGKQPVNPIKEIKRTSVFNDQSYILRYSFNFLPEFQVPIASAFMVKFNEEDPEGYRVKWRRY